MVDYSGQTNAAEPFAGQSHKSQSPALGTPCHPPCPVEFLLDTPDHGKIYAHGVYIQFSPNPDHQGRRIQWIDRLDVLHYLMTLPAGSNGKVYVVAQDVRKEHRSKEILEMFEGSPEIVGLALIRCLRSAKPALRALVEEVLGEETDDVQHAGEAEATKADSEPAQLTEEGPKTPEDDQDEGRQTEKDLLRERAEEANASTYAQTLMEDNGIDPDDIDGSGENGRIKKADVESWLELEGV